MIKFNKDKLVFCSDYLDLERNRAWFTIKNFKGEMTIEKDRCCLMNKLDSRQIRIFYRNIKNNEAYWSNWEFNDQI